MGLFLGFPKLVLPLLLLSRPLRAQQPGTNYLLTTYSQCGHSLINATQSSTDASVYYWMNYVSLTAGEDIPTNAVFGLQYNGNGAYYVYMSGADNFRLGAHPHNGGGYTIMSEASSDLSTQTWDVVPQDDGTTKLKTTWDSRDWYIGSNATGTNAMLLFNVTGENSQDDPGQHILFIEATVTSTMLVTATSYSTVYLGATTAVTSTTTTIVTANTTTAEVSNPSTCGLYR